MVSCKCKYPSENQAGWDINPVREFINSTLKKHARGIAEGVQNPFRQSNLEWLQFFYGNCCDGDWEHSWGVKIDTLDNPGWSFVFDLENTDLETRSFQFQKIERDEHDWIICKVADKKFVGWGGPNNLDELLGIFKEWVQNEVER